MVMKGYHWVWLFCFTKLISSRCTSGNTEDISLFFPCSVLSYITPDGADGSNRLSPLCRVFQHIANRATHSPNIGNPAKPQKTSGDKLFEQHTPVLFIISLMSYILQVNVRWLKDLCHGKILKPSNIVSWSETGTPTFCVTWPPTTKPCFLVHYSLHYHWTLALELNCVL